MFCSFRWRSSGGMGAEIAWRLEISCPFLMLGRKNGSGIARLFAAGDRALVVMKVHGVYR